MFTSVGLNIDTSPIRTTIGGVVSKEHIHFLVPVGKQKNSNTVNDSITVTGSKPERHQHLCIQLYIYNYIYNIVQHVCTSYIYMCV